jgi:uncharacterized repeat protein (TIGR03843 family)
MSDHQVLEPDRIVEILSKGEVSVEAAMPYSSNYTLLASINYDQIDLLGIYKPQRGERPLWDFARGTLYRREVAAYVVSEALQFGLVPPTVVRNGPYGPGMLQLYIDNDEEIHLFTMLKDGGFENEIRRLCAFDYVVNNADRKSGHGLLGSDGRLWAIDHGICFHSEYKLRTVLWDFIGEPLPSDVCAALVDFQTRLNQPDDPYAAALASLLDRGELRAMRRRIDTLISSGIYPAPGPGPNVPWPPV